MRLISICLLLASTHFLFAQKTKAPVTIDLSEALRQKLVGIRIEGMGGHQGESIKLTCQNLAGRYLRIRIPIGQLMEPRDTSEQTLVVAEEQVLALNVKSPASASLKTFCTQSGDLSPRVGSAFALGVLAPENLCKLLKFIVEKGKSDSAEAQNAVWCLTGPGHGLGGIGDPELTKFTADLLGKTIPGYKIRHETVTEIPGRPAELGKALVVEGNFVYYLEKDEKTVMVLLDGAGKQIKQLSKEELMKAGEHRSGLRLEVYNLDPGKYTVRMQTKTGRVIKDMEVEF